MDISKAWSFPVNLFFSVGLNFKMGTKTTNKNLKFVPVIISVALGPWETELQIRTCRNGQSSESLDALLCMYTALYNMEQNVHYFSVLLKELKNSPKIRFLPLKIRLLYHLNVYMHGVAAEKCTHLEDWWNMSITQLLFKLLLTVPLPSNKPALPQSTLLHHWI